MILEKQYDLFVSDIEMPVLDGLRLIGRIRARGMNLPIILASGSFLDWDAENNSQLRISAFLRKPFSLLQLTEAAKSALKMNL